MVKDGEIIVFKGICTARSCRIHDCFGKHILYPDDIACFKLAVVGVDGKTKGLFKVVCVLDGT